MKKWKRFLKLRKQDDRVKIILALAVLGAVFMIRAVYHGIRIYQTVQSSAEYVITADAPGGTLAGRQRELMQEENITAAGLWRQTSLTVKYQGRETAFSCSELSEDYMEEVYGIRDEGAMKTIYMNQKAISQLLQEGDGIGYFKENGEVRTLRVTYVKEADGDETFRQKTAEVVLVKEGVPEDAPFVFCKGDPIDLTKYASGIRVYTGGQELYGETVDRLQNKGFTIANMQEIRETEYLLQTEAVKIRYGVITAALCLFCAGVLEKFRKSRDL